MTDPTQQQGRDGQTPKIVCLCGSTRFYEAFQRANYDETMAGRIVLSVGFYPHQPGAVSLGEAIGKTYDSVTEMANQPLRLHGESVGCTPEQKAALDILHKRKIDLADEVLVLNVGGYIGDSTRSEVVHAVKAGKPIRWLEPDKAWDAPPFQIGDEVTFASNPGPVGRVRMLKADGRVLVEWEGNHSVVEEPRFLASAAADPTPQGDAHPVERQGAKPAEAEKPEIKPGVVYRLAGRGDWMRWWTPDGVTVWVGGKNAKAPYSIGEVLDSLAASLARGTIEPTDETPPATPATEDGPPSPAQVDHSKITTPKGRQCVIRSKYSDVNVQFGQHRGWGNYCRIYKSDGSSDQWPLRIEPSDDETKLLAAIDQWIDSLSPLAPAERVAYTRDTWPKGYVLVRAYTDDADSYGPPLLIRENGIYITGESGMPEWATWSQLADLGEISTDGGLTFSPASRPAAAGEGTVR